MSPFVPLVLLFWSSFCVPSVAVRLCVAVRPPGYGPPSSWQPSRQRRRADDDQLLRRDLSKAFVIYAGDYEAFFSFSASALARSLARQLALEFRRSGTALEGFCSTFFVDADDGLEVLRVRRSSSTWKTSSSSCFSSENFRPRRPKKVVDVLRPCLGSDEERRCSFVSWTIVDILAGTCGSVVTSVLRFFFPKR
ncbi:unnamed protein product [Calypogeia fissa]